MISLKVSKFSIWKNSIKMDLAFLISSLISRYFFLLFLTKLIFLKLAITEKWNDDYSNPNSIQFNVKAAKYTGIMKKWFLVPGSEFVSLDAVSMTKVENGLSCSETGVPAVADQSALDALLVVTDDDVIKNNPFIDTVGVE